MFAHFFMFFSLNYSRVKNKIIRSLKGKKVTKLRFMLEIRLSQRGLQAIQRFDKAIDISHLQVRRWL